MNVGSICSRIFITCQPDTSTFGATGPLRNHHVSDLVVAREIEPSKLFVADIMS